MTSGEAAKLVSPTAITNSIPRPRSPRRPDYRPGGGGGGGGVGLLSAESFQRTYSGKNPNVRRRPHEEMGHFGDQPRLCASIDFLNLNSRSSDDKNGCIQKSLSQSRDYAEKYGPGAKRNLGVCVQQTNHAAGRAGVGMAEFAMTAAEVYRQECKSDNRGEDSLFFQDQLNREENSLMGNDDSSASDMERRDSKNVSPEKRRRNNTPTSAASSRRGQFPNSIHITKDSSDGDISPPRVDRMNTRDFDPSEYNDGELRQARMQLFKMGQKGEISDPESRLKLTLQDLDRQDGIIDGLKKQLRMTQKCLDEKVDELTDAKARAQEKQYKATEVRARAVQEKKRLEDMYEKELEQNRKLESMVSTLQVEVSSLKVSLRNARAEAKNNNPRNPQSPPHSTPSESAQLISLRAEIVDLRSQLAESKAANLDDASSLNAMGDIDELKKKLAETEFDLRVLQEKDLDLQRLEDRHLETQKQLTEQVQSYKSAAAEAKSQMEIASREARTAKKDAQAELVKVRASLQRLERERSRKRLHSAADLDKVNRQLNKAREETTKVKKQLEDEQKKSKTSMSKLKSELDDMRKKLIQANKDGVSKGTETMKDRRKSQRDLMKMTQETKELQKQLKVKDEKIESLTRIVDRMEKGSTVEEKKQQDDKDAEALDASLLEAEMKLLKSNEASLRAELKLKNTLLEEAREKSANEAQEKTNAGSLRRQLELFKSNSSLNTEDSKTIVSVLQDQIDELKAKLAESKRSEKPEALKAMEQAYLNQICVLKARLADSESKCKEETFRAEEERRISREKDAERAQAVEKLRSEKEAVDTENSNLEDTIIELRKKLASTVPQIERQLSASTESDKTEAPKNLTRLRNELALARARLSAAREQSSLSFETHSHSFSDRSESVDTVQNRSLMGKVTSEAPNTPPRWTSVREQSSHSLGTRSLSFGDQAKPMDTINRTKSLVDKISSPPTSPDKSVDSGESSWAPPFLRSSTPTSFMTSSDRPSLPFQPATKAPSETIKASPQSSPRRSVSSDLQEQIDASNRRLEEANSRLKDLVVRADFPQKSSNTGTSLGLSPARMPYCGREPLQPIVTLDDTGEISEGHDGALNEVMRSSSGSIEVSRWQYADI